MERSPKICSHPCFDNKCLFIINDQDRVLHPFTAYSIDIAFQSVTDHLPDSCVVEIKQHLCSKPFRILNIFSTFKSTDKTINIIVATTKKCTIKKGDIIGHVQLSSLQHALHRMKGILRRNYNFMFQYLNKSY